MTPVFADSHFLIAMINPRDQWHERAVTVLTTLDRPIVTTQFALLEVADAFARPAQRRFYGELIEGLLANPDVTILPASSELFTEGEQLYFARADKSWPLTDCISFCVMKSQGLQDALTADHHFEQAGFVALLK